MPIQHYIFLSLALFAIGIMGVLMRRNAIIVFMCIELMLNAVNLLMVAFSKMYGNSDAQIFVFFIMVVAAAEVAVGISHYCNDVSEGTFGGCKYFEQIETLKCKLK